MAEKEAIDYDFEVQFYESILRKVPGYLGVVEILGHLYTETGRIDDGLRMDLLATELDPENPMHHYNLACSYSLKNQLNPAFHALKQAIDLGYDDLEWLLQDDALNNLHEHPSFLALVEQIRRTSS